MESVFLYNVRSFTPLCLKFRFFFYIEHSSVLLIDACHKQSFAIFRIRSITPLWCIFYRSSILSSNTSGIISYCIVYPYLPTRYYPIKCNIYYYLTYYTHTAVTRDFTGVTRREVTT